MRGVGEEEGASQPSVGRKRVTTRQEKRFPAHFPPSPLRAAPSRDSRACTSPRRTTASSKNSGNQRPGRRKRRGGEDGEGEIGVTVGIQSVVLPSLSPTLPLSPSSPLSDDHHHHRITAIALLILLTNSPPVSALQGPDSRNLPPSKCDRRIDPDFLFLHPPPPPSPTTLGGKPAADP